MRIFEAYLDEKILYYPNDETFAVMNDTLDMALNEAGTFEFDIPRDNLRFDEFKIRSSMIQVLQNDKEIFYGEVREVIDNFDFTRHIYAVGELAFLFDSIQPQKVYQCTPAQMFEEMINIHNSQVEPRKRFAVGEVSVTDPNDYVYHFTNREDTLTALREKLCKTLNGYLKITKVNGVRYINLVPIERYGTFCTQEIQFGENLLDFVVNNSGLEIATSVIPIGAMIEEGNRTERAVPGLDEYVSIVGTNTDDFHKNKNDDFIINDSAVSQFGHIRVTKEWSDVHTPEILREKATDWIKTVQFSKLTLEVSAFDQNLTDVNIDSFFLGDTVSVWALPFGMESVVFPVQKKTIYMTDLIKNRMILGSSYTKSYTTQASEAVNAVFEEIPETSPILKSAKDNARKILEGTEGGHIVFNLDEGGNYLEEEIICDGPTEAQSLRKWVWNLGGFGYLKRKSLEDEWTDLGVAITMDGKIVADYITAGVLRGITIEGNTIKGGTITIGNNFSVDNAGNMKAANANISGIINSTEGNIGGWNLSSNGFSKGPTSIYDTKDGMHVGTDGIRTNKGSFHTIISDGAITTNGQFSANYLNANKGGTLTGVTVQNGTIQNCAITVPYYGTNYYGVTTTVGIPLADGKTHSFIFANGILIRVS